jgi:hypothetical protein
MYKIWSGIHRGKRIRAPIVHLRTQTANIRHFGVSHHKLGRNLFGSTLKRMCSVDNRGPAAQAQGQVIC